MKNNVIPAQAGIQSHPERTHGSRRLDPRLRGGDGI
jgi:hypothetical protein